MQRGHPKKLYEDEQVVAFYDIAPQAKVHFLVIPKKHILCRRADRRKMALCWAGVFAVIAKLAREQGLDNGYRVISNVGEDAGQTVSICTSMFWAARSRLSDSGKSKGRSLNMAKTYTLNVAGLTRELTICKVNDHGHCGLHHAGRRRADGWSLPLSCSRNARILTSC